MNEICQLEFFDSPETVMLREFRKLQESMGATRRGLFARHQELSRMYLELRNEVDHLKANKSKGDKNELGTCFGDCRC